MKPTVYCITGIYKITSPSGKVYIGQAWDIKRRFREYTYLQKSKQQSKLHSSFSKYSPENHIFEIVHYLPNDISQTVMDTYEQFYIDLYNNIGVELLNLREAGSRGKHSKESKKKLSIAHSGKILSEETKKRISEGRKGKNLGKSNPMFGIGLIGDAKKRMIASKIGKKQSPETIIKRVEARRKTMEERKCPTSQLYI